LTSAFAAPSPGDDRAALAHGQLWMIAGAVLFGGMAVTVRAVSAVPASEIALLRFVVGLAGVALLGAMRPGMLKPTRWGPLALRGVFGGVSVPLYFFALSTVGAGLGTLLNNTYPMWAAVFGAAAIGERLTGRVLAGLAIALAGLVIVVGPSELTGLVGGLSDRRIAAGLMAGLISGMLGGAATTLIRSLRKTESALSIFGSFCLIGLLATAWPAWTQWQSLTTRQMLLLLLMGLLSLGAQLVFTYALKFIPASGSIINLFTVVVAYTLAGVLLGEAIAPQAIVGGAIVMAGIYFVTSSGAAPAPALNAAEDVEATSAS
jgi:drug/metabolite transporter (DMT)-like permease